MDLTILLASAIHDMKNQLHLLAPDLAYLTNSTDPNVSQVGENISKKVVGMDSSLVRLLLLYRMSSESGTVPVNISESYVADLLNSLSETASGSLNSLPDRPMRDRVVCEIRCDPGLVGYFDENLVSAVLRDALDNARRFARSKILISASEEGVGTRIVIEDDGEGPGTSAAESNFQASNTGVGLHLAECVAKAHSSKESAGYARLEVSRDLGGGAFVLFLP